MPVDTLELARRIEAAGFSRQQAQGFAAAFADALLECRYASGIPFDARSFTRKLDEAGFPPQQAQSIPVAIAKTLADTGFFRN
jgi:hypothetical protein